MTTAPKPARNPIWRAIAATLTDERIEQAIQAVLASLQTQLDARLRS